MLQYSLKNISLLLYLSNRTGISYFNLFRRFTCLSSSFTSHRSIKNSNFQQIINLNPTDKRLAHTTKGWKLIANPKNEENDGETVLHNFVATACEDGSKAVKHTALLHELNKCKSVGEQIHTLSSILSLSREELKNRKAFCEHLQKLVEPFFPPIKVQQFGSSINGFGFNGCDIDACLTMEGIDETNEKEYANFWEVPNMDDVLSRRLSPDIVARLHPKFRLRFIRRILRKLGDGIKEPILLIRGRCPLLRFYHEKFDLFCDFSCQNRFALRNTRFLRFASVLDDRIALLVKILRYWGKNNKFVGDIDLFNSYAFTVMVLCFFQNTSPPILPPFKYLIENADYITMGDVEDDEHLLKSLAKIPPTQNKQSAEELLKEFFYYFLYFDFSRVMLPLTASSVPKQDFRSNEDPPTDIFEMSTISVQDPFRHSFNTTHGANFRACRKFVCEVVEACKLYQDEQKWQVSNDGDWGLSLLLRKSSVTFFKENLFNDEKINDLDIKFESQHFEYDINSDESTDLFLKKAAENVLKVLDIGLLFKCQLMHATQGSKHRPILKFNCAAFHNTWVGRNHVMKEHFANASDHDPLQLEHLISLKLVPTDCEKKEVIFRLLCECYSVKENDAISLKVRFKSLSGKISPIVPIFLKDKLPKFLHSML